MCIAVSGFLPPKPPPQYSLTNTTLALSTPAQFPTDWLTWASDCADPCK